ncbi:hypothetical protein EP331_04875 [bacterium]|nr:MAG: hypothetical protein EP331_04875 [bacterium]
MSKEEYRKITADEAKELLKSGKARPTKGSSFIDMQSLLFSLLVFVVIAASATIYYEVFADTRVIKDYKPQAFTSIIFESAYPSTAGIPSLAAENNYSAIDSIITPILYDVQLTPEQNKFLWLYKNELLLATHQYETALQFSQSLQSRFAEDKSTIAPIFWYKAHAYYYLKRFSEAHELFATIAIMKHPLYSEKAFEYQQEIYDLIRTDGINFFFD